MNPLISKLLKEYTAASASAAGKAAAVYVRSKASRRFCATVNFSSEVYSRYVEKYIKHVYKKRNRDGNTYLDIASGNPSKLEVSLRPTRFSFYLDDMTYCSIRFDRRELEDDSKYREELSYVSVTFIGLNAYYHSHRLITFIKAKMKKNRDQGRFISANYQSGGGYIYFPYKSFDEIILKDKKKILTSLDNFRKNHATFQHYGIPYKLGILLYGEPGTGKSSVVKAIISYASDSYECQNQVTYLDLSKNIDLLQRDLRYIYQNSQDLDFKQGKRINIVVMEELDELLPKDREESSKEDEAKVNAMLQFLDGPMSPENTIILATTNHIDRLDPALIREGRFDLKIKFEAFNEVQAKEMCDKFHESYEILNDISYPISPVSLQNKIFNKKFSKEIPEKM